MLQQRIDYFARMTKEEKLNLTINDFTVSEFKEIINETALCENDRLIVIYRYINCMPYEEISEKIGIDLKTCRARMEKIDSKIKSTYLKFFYR
ncbi:MAG: hypothetical protein NC087_01970 [Anaeroplasma bactoclasticum]|nr:hypothetical protein [Anaeroplasma bactoclasticum]